MKKNIVIGGIAALVFVILGAICICKAPNRSGDKQEEGGITTEIDSSQETTGTTTILHAEIEDNQGEVSDIEIYEISGQENTLTEFEGGAAGGAAVSEEQYSQPDMTQEYNEIKSEMFGETGMGGTSEVYVSPGYSEGN